MPLNACLRLTLGTIFVASALFRAGTSAQSPDTQPNPYRVVPNHFKLPDGRTMGSTAAIDIDRDGRSVWVFERCGGASQALACAESSLAPVMEFDSSGKIVKSFGGGMFVSPHGIHVDPFGNVWVTDGNGKGEKGQQVFKFSPDGKVLLTLGKAGVTGHLQSTVGRVGRAKRRHLRGRWPRWQVERSHRQIFEGREIHQSLGQSRLGPR
jgi:hypothetical protein